MKNRPLIGALLLSGTLFFSGCLSVDWERSRQGEPPRQEAIDYLQPKKVGLTQCLMVLGAPHLVQRGPGQSTDLLWASFEKDGWGVNLDTRESHSDYHDSNGGTEGLRLRFDARWRLIEKSVGSFPDLSRAKVDQD